MATNLPSILGYFCDEPTVASVRLTHFSYPPLAPNEEVVLQRQNCADLKILQLMHDDWEALPAEVKGWQP